MALRSPRLRSLLRPPCRFFKACVIPTLSYAAPVWWPSKVEKGRLTGKRLHAKVFGKVQRRALIIICVAFRTTPTHALEHKASIPPLRLAQDKTVRDAGVRLSKLDLRNPVMERLPGAWRNGRGPESPAMRANCKPTPLTQAASHGDPNGERIAAHLVPPWRCTKADYPGRYTVTGKGTSSRKDEAAKAHVNRLGSLQHPHVLIAYADGSSLEVEKKARTGAACVLPHNGTQVKAIKAGLGRHAEVYNAELTALALALRAAMTCADGHPQITNIILFSDNLAATNVITDPRPRDGQLLAHNFHTRACAFLDKSDSHSLEIAWCPSHHNIKRNETADALTKEATALPRNQRDRILGTNSQNPVVAQFPKSDMMLIRWWNGVFLKFSSTEQNFWIKDNNNFILDSVNCGQRTQRELVHKMRK